MSPTPTNSNDNAKKELPRIVLMVPLRRCGSHALRLRLNISDEFFAPYPLHVVDFLPLLPLYGDLEDDDNWRLLIDDIVGLQKALMVEWKGVDLDTETVFEELESLGGPRNVHNIVGHLLRVAGRDSTAACNKNVKVTLDKSLDGVHYADEYLECYPDLLFLNVVRDPRAQIASMNDAIIHDFSTLNNTEIWLKAYEKMDEIMKKYPEKVLTIRFEDFICDQSNTIQKVCDFIGIEYNDNLCDIKQSEEGKEMAALSPLWTSNFSHPMKETIDKFKNKLSHDDIELIETLCGSYMDRYGYEKITKANAIVTEDDRLQARESHEVNKVRAWDDLKKDTKFDKDFALRKIRANFIASCRQKLEERIARNRDCSSPIPNERKVEHSSPTTVIHHH